MLCYSSRIISDAKTSVFISPPVLGLRLLEAGARHHQASFGARKISKLNTVKIENKEEQSYPLSHSLSRFRLVDWSQAQTNMITLHHLEYSQSFRIIWLLEELNAEYDLVLYKRTPDLVAPDDFKQISPLGTSPCITDGDLSLSESNAIIDYILDKHDVEHKFRPSSASPDRTDYLFWFHSAQGSLMPLMLMDSTWRLVIQKVPCPLNYLFKTVFSKFQQSFLLPRLTKLLDVCQAQLSDKEFLAGNSLTAADVTMIYPMESCLTKYPELLETEYPKCMAWLHHMYERPKFQAAQKRVGETHVTVAQDLYK